MTLAEDESAVCVGAAYRVDEAVFEHLDHREKNGYERLEVTVRLDRDDGSLPLQAEIVRSATYIAAPGNMAFLGPANLDDMAAHIARSAGPSGSNIDYLFELAAALDDLGVEDQHVTELASRCKALVHRAGLREA